MKQPGIHIYDLRGILPGSWSGGCRRLPPWFQKPQLIIAVQLKIVLVRYILNETAAVAFVELKALYLKVLAAFRAEIIKHLPPAVHGCFHSRREGAAYRRPGNGSGSFSVEDVSGTAFQAGTGFIYIYMGKITGLSVLCLNLNDGKGKGDAVIYKFCVLQFVLQG